VGNTVVLLQGLVRLRHQLLAELVAGVEAGDAVQPAPLPPPRSQRQRRDGEVGASERLPGGYLFTLETNSFAEAQPQLFVGWRLPAHEVVDDLLALNANQLPEHMAARRFFVGLDE